MNHLASSRKRLCPLSTMQRTVLAYEPAVRIVPLWMITLATR